MPRAADPKKAYLEFHGTGWRVSVAVPPAARKALGTARLKHKLGTDSLKVANVLKLAHVARFKRQIADALGTLDSPAKGDMKLAVELGKVARELKRSGTPEQWREFEEAVYERHAEIRWDGAQRRAFDHPDLVPADLEVPLPDQVVKANAFSGVAYGRATPIELRYEEYRAGLHVKARTLADDARAIGYLLDWCKREGVPPMLEEIDLKRAHAFADAFQGMTGLHHVTCAKYMGRLAGFWKWLVPREDAVNIFAGVTVKGPKTPHKHKERAFKEAEIATLLMGPATPHMHDLMMIGALSGARLDAIVDLKVRDTWRRCLMFKPQKSEPAPRYVPQHPLLVPIIARRIAGKDPDDDLFPEWPPPANADSLRERSFKASNHFTDYRRLVKVDHRVPGKRRSLVNFHSFRRYFTTKLERASVPDDLISAILGHQRGSISLDVYSEGPTMRAARRAVSKVKLPPLDGSPVHEEIGLWVRDQTD